MLIENLKQVKTYLALEYNIRVVCLAFFAINLGSALWLQLLPIHLDHLGLTAVWIGAIIIGQVAAISIMSLPSGKLSDLIGRRPPLVVGSGLVVIITFLLYFAVDPTVIFILVVLDGVAWGLIVPAVIALIAESAPPTQTGMAYASYYFSAFLATVVGSAFSGILADLLGFPSLFLIGATVSTFAFLILYFFIKETVITKNSHRIALKQSVLKSIPETVALLRNNSDLTWLAVAIAIHAFGFAMFTPFIPLYAKYGIRLDVVQIGFLLAIWNAGFLLSQIPSGRLTDLLGSRPTLVIHFILSSVTWGLYPLFPNFGLAAVTLILMGAVGAMDMPARRIMMLESSPKGGKATIVGGLDFITGVASILAPIIGGAFWDRMGYSAPFIGAAILNLFACVPLVLLLKKQRMNNSTLN